MSIHRKWCVTAKEIYMTRSYSYIARIRSSASSEGIKQFITSTIKNMKMINSKLFSVVLYKSPTFNPI